MAKKYIDHKLKISDSWDGNLSERISDIENGKDITYLHVISKNVFKIIEDNFKDDISIIDVGCGIGYLTNLISKSYTNIAGIDIAEKSVEYAKNKYKHIDFSVNDIYDFIPAIKYDLLLATMVVHNVPCMPEFFEKAATVLKDNGHMLITILHPSFWPEEKIENFFYNKINKEYEVVFRGNKNGKYTHTVSYFHRTLEYYQNTMKKHGLEIVYTEEMYEYENFKNNIRKTEPHILTWLVKSVK